MASKVKVLRKSSEVNEKTTADSPSNEQMTEEEFLKQRGLGQ
eukprot:UN15889